MREEAVPKERVERQVGAAAVPELEAVEGVSDLEGVAGYAVG